MELHNILLISLSIGVLLLLIIRWNILKAAMRPLPVEQKLDMGGSMTIGTREVQEDCYLLKESRDVTLMVLADGTGNAYGGRIAARTAVEVFADIFSSFNMLDNPKCFFRKAFSSANREILKALDNGQKGASSLAAAIVYQNKLFYSVVGNVRVYVYRKGDLIPVSTGHTIDVLAKDGFVSGKITRTEALSILESQRIYNFLGQDGFCDIELFDEPITLISNDIVILMTDGIYALLSYAEIEETLIKKLSSEKMAFEIIEKVNKHQQEDKDNASILLLKTGEMAV